MMKKFMTVVMTGIFAFSVSTNIYAYNGKDASIYAQGYTANDDYKTTSYNTNYYSFGNDCTNYVSQCVKAGGVTVKENTTYTERSTLPTLSYIYDDDTSYRYWYMKKKYSSIRRKDYYWLTKSWSNVSEFRNYHGYHEGTVYKYPKSERGKNDLISDVKPGDVVQLGNEHTIIISQVSYGQKNGETTKYCGHTKNRKNVSLSNIFKSGAYNSADCMYRISFK